MSRPLQLIAVTDFGLEAVARRELEALGYEPRIVSPGRLAFAGDLRAICRANLWLRSADRVLLQLASFPATDFDTLFETVRELGWQQWLQADAAFPVVGRCYQSQLSSLPACQRTVKKAVVESLRAAHGVQSLPESGPEYKIEVAILKDQATLSIDTTGPGLHKRGYRLRTTSAPLKESMAAALVLLSFWQDGRPLIDPFCGSGTIPIEAALIGCNRAPGLLREFASQPWPQLPQDEWREARQEATDLAGDCLQENLVGLDIDGRAMQAARDNAERAGVSDQIHFQQKPFDELSSKKTYGCVVTNPPYGERLGRDQDLTRLYRSMPLVLRGLPTWSHFILTSFPDFETLIGRQADRRRKLYNGRIECTYYQFHGPRPSHSARDASTSAGNASAVSPNADAANTDAASTEAANTDAVNTEAVNTEAVNTEAVNTEAAGESAPDVAAAVSLPEKPSSGQSAAASGPVFGGLSEKSKEQATLFESRLRKTARHLRRWPTRRGIDCYRVYDRDIPEIPLVVDRYDQHLRIVEQRRPHQRDLAHHADWLDLMVRTAAETLGIERRQVQVIADEPRGTTPGQTSQAVVVPEAGLRLEADLADPLETGLPLDYRTIRSMVREASAERRVLILWDGGALPTFAAAGGAASITMVDHQRRHLQRAERNLASNDLMANLTFVHEPPWRFLSSDSERAPFDLVVVDAPTRLQEPEPVGSWEIQPDHVELLNGVWRHISPDGILLFAARHRRFKMSESVLEGRELRDISRQTVPEDFRNRRVHRCWKIRATLSKLASSASS